MATAYLVDLGHLIFEGEHEFEQYAVSYDSQYGYYDDNQYYAFSRERAELEAQEWVEAEGDRAYGIVSETVLDDDITQEDIDEGSVDVEQEQYLVDDVVFAKAMIDGEIVDLFN